ncbi:MAG: hypothetical protein KGL39_24060, partial [Patescibacteria group bacterium]|nr:hypothetical protein [Patescibacteria group bacterium]
VGVCGEPVWPGRYGGSRLTPLQPRAEESEMEDAAKIRDEIAMHKRAIAAGNQWAAGRAHATPTIAERRQTIADLTEKLERLSSQP